MYLLIIFRRTVSFIFERVSFIIIVLFAIYKRRVIKYEYELKNMVLICAKSRDSL